MAQGWLTKNGIWRHKVTLTASDVKTGFSFPVELLGAPGSNKIIVVDPFSVVIKQSTGTAFDFVGGNCYLGNSNLFAIISSTKMNSNDYQLPSFVYNETVANGGVFLTENIANEPLYFGNDTNDASNGSRSVTLSFNYFILNVG